MFRLNRTIGYPIFALAIILPLALGPFPAGAENSASIAAQIKETLATLNLPAHTIELTSEKADRVRRAIKERDFHLAKRITVEVLNNSKLQNWRFHPFTNFMTSISDVYDTSFDARLTEWIDHNPDDAIPRLMRAQYYCDLAWFIRGSHFARNTQTAHMSAFENYAKKCYADADRAVHLDGNIPYGHYLKLQALRGFGISENMKIAFRDAISRFPNYYALYDYLLQTLQPKWGGTIDSMHAFVDDYAGRADDTSPLKLLYFSLDRYLLDAASTACYPNNRNNREQLAECVAHLMGKYNTPRLQAQLPLALGLYDRTNKYQFSIAVRPIISDMLNTSGGDLHSGVMLELVATAMKSDTRLTERPGSSTSNYMIDMIVSQSWYTKGFYDNALTKMQEALRDADRMSFPNEEEKLVTWGVIYQYIGGIYNKLNRFADMIAYEKAAIAVGNITQDEHLICYGLYQLKDFEKAVPACSAAIDHNRSRSLNARYWRGSVYRGLNRLDEALNDFAVVADSEADFRPNAVLGMSMIYFGRNDMRSALDALNRYPFLYDPNVTSKSNIAVGYNNRCYAYMELGELQKAFDDCTASLRYGSIPDAFRKQQELIKRLGATNQKETSDNRDTIVPPTERMP